MKERIPINPETLRWARESKNILIKDVAQRMHKRREDIEDWENGKASPTYLQLDTLAYKIYKRPIAIFFFPEPPEETTPEQSFRTLPESEFMELSPPFLHLFGQAQAMQIKLEELNDGVNPVTKRIFEDLGFKPSDTVDNMVNIVRKYLGINLETQIRWENPDTAFKKWRNTIEQKGIFVFKQAFKQDGISGFCLCNPTFPIIYVNNSMPKTRQIFTLFHELTHLLLRTSGIDKRNDDFIARMRGDNRKIEILCNRFTNEFLVPKSDFDRSIRGIDIEERTIINLANRYNVSREVILRKCLDRQLIDQDYYDRKRHQWIKEAKRERSKSKTGGNYYLTQVAYLGDNYLNLAFKKYYQHRISIEQLADYLGGVRIKNIPGLETAFLDKGETM